MAQPRSYPYSGRASITQNPIPAPNQTQISGTLDGKPSITLDLINSDDEKRASLVASFAELSKAITDAQKLFVQSYKDISHTLLNLDKIKKERVQNVPNQQNIVEKPKSDNVVSTFELIKKLKNS